VAGGQSWTTGWIPAPWHSLWKHGEWQTRRGDFQLMLSDFRWVRSGSSAGQSFEVGPNPNELCTAEPQCQSSLKASAPPTRHRAETERM